jgi:hypothetical protein
MLMARIITEERSRRRCRRRRPIVIIIIMAFLTIIMDECYVVFVLVFPVVNKPDETTSPSKLPLLWWEASTVGVTCKMETLMVSTLSTAPVADAIVSPARGATVVRQDSRSVCL